MKKFVKYKTNHGEFTLRQVRKYLQDNSPKIWSIISRITSTYDITFKHILYYIIFNDELCEINLEEFDAHFCANLPIFLSIIILVKTQYVLYMICSECQTMFYIMKSQKI